MKILKGYVNWMEGRANRPNIYLLVDEIPTLEDMRFTLHDKGGTIDGGIYFAENDGYCRFFSHHGKNNNGGFGGNKYDITMIGGMSKTLHGPWSSNSGEVNERGFGPCVEVYLTTDTTAYARGHTFGAGCVLLSKLREAADRIDVGTGYTWRPGAPYAAQVAFPVGSRFALACNGQVRVDHRGGTDYKLVVRPEVFPDGALIENIREALKATLALPKPLACITHGGNYFAADCDECQRRWAVNQGPALAYEIAERYQRHVPYAPIDTLLALSSYEAAVQFPDGEYWVKPATI